MKLHLAQPSGNMLITGYGDGWVEINEQRHTPQSLVVLPSLLHLEWHASDFESLDEQHFQQLAELAPEIVLLGTGPTHRFVHPRLARALTESGIGLECMSTPAACRTYNILMAEGRHVAAALIL